MTITARQLRLIHVAKRQVGWDEDTWRTVLATIAGVTSSRDLDGEGFDAVLAYAEHCGFRPLHAKGPNFGNRKDMATFAQCELIRTLWAEFTRGAGDAAGLDKWVLRTFKVSSLRFLTREAGQKAITALMAMKRRVA